MTKRFQELIEELPNDRQERIADEARALMVEYELLKRLRRDRDVTQQTLASLMGIRQSSVSKLENQSDMHLGTLRRYVEALGGRLEIRAHFPDQEVELTGLARTPEVPTTT